MISHRRAIVIGGQASGVGKTTVALGLMTAFRRRGLVVQPFKCGPDFIDAGHHTRVCGRQSRNLDGWMLSPETNTTVFVEQSGTADIAVIEGVMGLFDGASRSAQGSTAAMAKHLGVPVLLVVDASGMAASAAALVRGFETFDPSVGVGGVVFNRIGGAGHYALLKDALEQAGCAPVVGYLPKEASIRIPERYLGLHTADEEAFPDAALDRLSSLMEQFIDLDRVLDIAAVKGPRNAPAIAPRSARTDVRIAVARDRAFCFYYQDNLDSLRRAGAEIVEFSPLVDRALPDGTDALYIGGGYPELYASTLSGNGSMRSAILKFAKAGGPIYAECGGLMYLGRHLRLQDGRRHAMIGVLPLDTAMTDRLVHLGYTEVSFSTDCLLGPRGTMTRGHCFHHSAIESIAGDVACAYHVRATRDGAESVEGYVVDNVLASYVHLHFLSNPELARHFVEAARTSRAVLSVHCETGNVLPGLDPISLKDEVRSFTAAALPHENP